MPDRNKLDTNKYVLTKRSVYWCLGIAFAVVIEYLWLEELLDLPHHILGTPETPVNWAECVLETIVFVVLGAAVILFARRLFRRIRYLEGFLPVCSFCKRIRVGEKWIPIETYMREHSSLELTHSLCPECAKKHYDYEEAGQKRE